MRFCSVGLRLMCGLFAAFLMSCTQLPMKHFNIQDEWLRRVPQTSAASALSPDWRHGPFMQIYVRGYQDSNGDGHGDLRGLIRRLDYLQSLGVKGLWLMPIMESQDKDHGYAVTHYRAIDPDYGTMDDFDALIREAHHRGMGVILDYLINHSATDHPLFERASMDRHSPFRDWYVWSDRKPLGWKIYNQDPWYEMDTGFYFAGFGHQMPDFNLRNPDVVAWHEDNLRFWLNRGVDGFRFDAAGNLIENGPDKWELQPENHVLMKRLRDVVHAYDHRFVVCEAPGGPQAFAGQDSCGHSFAFAQQANIIGAAAGDEDSISDAAHYFLTAPQGMATFLSNHDHFAGDRPFDQLEGQMSELRLAAAMYLLMPGTPFIYYGEEIGMAGAKNLMGDHRLRTPMSWTGDPLAAGFSEVAPFRAQSANAQRHHVQLQESQPGSLLNHYRQLIALRNSQPALMKGSYEHVSVRGTTLVFHRRWAGEHLVVMFNYSRKPAEVPVDHLPPQAQLRLLGGPVQTASDRVVREGKVMMRLPAQTFGVWAVDVSR